MRGSPKADPSKDKLLKSFNYDSEAGELVWKYIDRSDFQSEVGWKIASSKNLNKAAGFMMPQGYIRIRGFGQNFMAHRLIWVWHNGAIPYKKVIDHIDGNRANNRIENLRMVDASLNGRNRALGKNNTSGVSGVYWRKQNKKWIATCSFFGMKHHVGTFANISDAESALRKFRSNYAFSRRHGNRS